MTDRAAMIARAQAALRTYWGASGAPSAEDCVAIREALAIYDGPCASWQQLLDGALETIEVFVSWHQGESVHRLSYCGALQPWGEHDIGEVWPEPTIAAAEAA